MAAPIRLRCLKWAGHSDVRLTTQTSAHMPAEELRRAVGVPDRMGLEGVGGTGITHRQARRLEGVVEWMASMLGKSAGRGKFRTLPARSVGYRCFTPDAPVTLFSSAPVSGERSRGRGEAGIHRYRGSRRSLPPRGRSRTRTTRRRRPPRASERPPRRW